MEVTIERILPGGLGLAHAGGKTIMVALAAPGDRLRVRIEKVKGNVSFASIEEVIEPSPNRIEPPCPYFGRCGGCDFQQLSYQAQLDAKVEMIRDCLHRIAGLEKLPECEIVAAPNQWKYRSRTQWQYDSARKRLGYFESGSRRVCDVSECAVLAPELQASLELVRNLMLDNRLPMEARDFRAVAGDKGVAISPSVSGPKIREMNRSIHGETYTLRPESFFQTNADLLPKLIDMALRDAQGETAIELYCGVGLFTIPLARRFKQVSAVESDRDATAFARKNLTRAGLSNTKIDCEDVGDWLQKNLESAGKAKQRRRFGSPADDSLNEGQIQSAVDAGALQIDFVLLDPPRTGAESRVINQLLRLEPGRICYVSCDPATLARDLKKLFTGGYSLESIVAFDMFPQTHHVEAVVHLSQEIRSNDA